MKICNSYGRIFWKNERMRNMKKIIMIVTSVLILSSCGVIGAAGSIAGGTIKAAGTVAGAAIKTTGNIIGGIIGGNEG